MANKLLPGAIFPMLYAGGECPEATIVNPKIAGITADRYYNMVNRNTQLPGM